MKQVALLLILLAGGARLVAQTVAPAGAFSVVRTRVRSEFSGGAQEFQGFVVGGEGSLRLGPIDLAASYAQGRLDALGSGGLGHDMVEGNALLGVRLGPWLRVAGGPHARSYVGGGGTQRWLFWEARARVAGAWVGDAVRGYAELWRALAATANVPEPFDHAQGGEAGMVVHLAHAPLELRWAYRIDHAVLGTNTRQETVEGLVLAVGLAGR